MIKGAKEYITGLQNTLTDIEKDIENLKDGIGKLELKIDTENEFKIDTIKKNKVIQSEINMLKTALNGAYKKRDELVANNATTAYKDVKALINTFKQEQRTTTNKKNLLIIEKVEEIRGLREDIKQKDKEVHDEIQQFIKEVENYLDPEPKNELVIFGEATKQSEFLKHRNGLTAVNGGTTFVNEVREYVLGIEKGLYDPLHFQQTALDELKDSLKK